MRIAISRHGNIDTIMEIKSFDITPADNDEGMDLFIAFWTTDYKPFDGDGGYDWLGWYRIGQNGLTYEDCEKHAQKIAKQLLTKGYYEFTEKDDKYIEFR